MSVDEIAQKIQATYASAQTLTADFSKITRFRKNNLVKNAHGKVTFVKPGKMNWVFDNPAGDRLTSDGYTLKAYEKAIDQIYEQPLDKSPYPAAFAFLRGKGDFSSAFVLKKLDSKRMKFEGGLVLEGVPRETSPAYQRAFFFIDPGTWTVVRVALVDSQGNTNHIQFSGIKLNEPVDETIFRLVVPHTSTIRPHN